MTTLDFLIALRDGIDTPELHCDPLPVTSSWRYMVDNAIERENSMADKFAAAVENWKPEILNYFGTGATNAYTEAANGLAKIANRNGRGYSFEAIRAKIIYGPTVKRGKFGESVVDEEIFAELTRPFVETPQTDAEKETEGGQ